MGDKMCDGRSYGILVYLPALVNALAHVRCRRKLVFGVNVNLDDIRNSMLWGGLLEMGQS